MPFRDLIKMTNLTITNKNGEKYTTQGQNQNNKIFKYGVIQ